MKVNIELKKPQFKEAKEKVAEKATSVKDKVKSFAEEHFWTVYWIAGLLYTAVTVAMSAFIWTKVTRR